MDDGAYEAEALPGQRRSGPVRYDGPLQQAVDVFNTGEYPRRVASLTRSLGAPEVTVREGEAVASSVVIVLAWELCWYTYEVDLDDLQGLQARAIAQGTELTELGPEDRLGQRARGRARRARADLDPSRARSHGCARVDYRKSRSKIGASMIYLRRTQAAGR